MRYQHLRSRCFRRLSQPVLLSLLVLPVFSASAADAADPPAVAVAAPAKAAAPTAPAVLSLDDGGFAAGDLAEIDRPGVLRWQAVGFVSPFEFKFGRVNAIHWVPPANLAKPEGDFCFELAGGDVVYGSLAALDEKEAQFDVPRIGRLRVPRAAIHRIYRWRESADLIYLGPNGLVGWRDTGPARTVAGSVPVGAVIAEVEQVEAPPGRPVMALAPPAPQQLTPKSWRDEAGQLMTDQEGASIHGDFGIPAQATIEFEVSWKKKPDFVFALGTGDQPDSVKRAFRFEAWGGDLIVQRELEKEADLAVVQEIVPGPGRAHFQVYLDQEKNRITIFSQLGKQLASLKVGSSKSPVHSGVDLTNLRGDLRLEWLRIVRWSGEPPREVRADQARIHRSDGSIVYGKVTRFDAASKEFLINSGTEETRIGPDKVSSVVLSLPGEEKPRALRVVYQDGTRFSGDLQKIEKGALVLKVPGVAEMLRLPLKGLRSLVVLSAADEAPTKEGSTGRLEIPGVQLSGKLVDGNEKPGSTCLAWQPLASETASPIASGVSGHIIYKEPPPPAPPTQLTQLQQQRQQLVMMRQMQVQQQREVGVGGMALRFMNAMAEPSAAGAAGGQPSEERRSLFLRDGDVIPSVVTKIDEKGVWFRSSLSASTFVPNEKVKAIELAVEPPNTVPPVRLTRSKRDRLLMLPRMQKTDPPTHLIRSKNGDYLRGRVTGMDEKTLSVETRLENKAVPRDRISRIIWLHADELDPSKKPLESSSSTQVQALRNDGVRLTFRAEKFAEGSLSGKSDVLGPCQVAVHQIDQLLIGGEIQKAAAQLAYQQWKLTNAPDPKYVTAGEGGDGSDAGVESPLVGKPAPDFDLALVGGQRFKLSASKGNVVVLDFWATWCGPCLQVMPQVERGAAAFKDQGVRLIAVNLQETAEQVTAMLERQKLNVTVALDRDGAVADHYNAVAIPQTVIIDREGKVARVFVGGGAHLEDQLKEALKAVVTGEKPKEPAPQGGGGK